MSLIPRPSLILFSFHVWWCFESSPGEILTSFCDNFRILMKSIECDRGSGLIVFSVYLNTYKHFQNWILWYWCSMISGKICLGECFAPLHASHGCCKCIRACGHTFCSGLDSCCLVLNWRLYAFIFTFKPFKLIQQLFWFRLPPCMV